MLNFIENASKIEDIKSGIIYKAVSPSGKAYIGKTIFSLNDRKIQHNKYYKKFNTKFYNAIRKYGIDGFAWEILYENIPENQINNMEIWVIANYDSCENGYNGTIGCGGGDTFSLLSEERKIKKIEKFIKKMTGRCFLTEEGKRKISEKARLRQADKTKCPAYGKKQSKNHISKRVEARKKTLQNMTQQERSTPYIKAFSNNKERSEKISKSIKKVWRSGNKKLIQNLNNINCPEQLERKRKRFQENNPWSLQGIMKRFNCDELQAKQIIFKRIKKMLESRKIKLGY